MKEAKVYSYNRISSADQRKGFGLQRQREYAEEYARKQGLELDDSLKLEDPGRSAFHGEHRTKGILGQFLKAIESGQIVSGSVLIVEDLDRLSRQNPWDAQDQLSGIIRAGIKVVTTRDGQEYSLDNDDNPIGPVIASLKIFLAYDESKKKSERHKKNWEKKRANIDSEIITKNGPAWLIPSSDGKSFEVAKGAKETIRRVFEMKLAGISSQKIAATLNQDPQSWKPPRKHKNQQGEGWRASYVEKVLHSIAVIGQYQPGRLPTPGEKRENGNGHKQRVPAGEVIEDYYPAIIERGLFYQVQQRFQDNTAKRKGEGKGGRVGTVNNLFSYIAKCGYCGAPMSTVPKGKPPKGGVYIVCDKARRGVGCVKAYVRYDEKENGFENVILQYCRGLNAKEVMGETQDARAAEITLKQGWLDKAEAEIQGIEPAIERFLDDMETEKDKRVRERISNRIAKLEDRKEFLGQEMERFEHEIASLSKLFENTEARLDSVKKLIEFFKNTGDDKTDPRRIEVRLKLREEIRRLIDRIDVYPLGSPRFTAESAEKALQDMALVCPEGTGDYERIKEQLRLHVEKAKDFLTITVHFSTGSKQTLHPRQQPVLTTEWDKEAGELKGWFIKPNGEEGSEVVSAPSP